MTTKEYNNSVKILHLEVLRFRVKPESYKSSNEGKKDKSYFNSEFNRLMKAGEWSYLDHKNLVRFVQISSYLGVTLTAEFTDFAD